MTILRSFSRRAALGGLLAADAAGRSASLACPSLHCRFKGVGGGKGGRVKGVGGGVGGAPGKVPQPGTAVDKQPAVMIAVEPKTIEREIHKEGYFNHRMKIAVDGTDYDVLPRDVQVDPAAVFDLRSDWKYYRHHKSSFLEMGLVKAAFLWELLTVGFNVRYLQEILSVIDADHVELELSHALGPCLVKGQGDEDAFFVVMPMRLD